MKLDIKERKNTNKKQKVDFKGERKEKAEKVDFRQGRKEEK